MIRVGETVNIEVGGSIFSALVTARWVTDLGAVVRVAYPDAATGTLKVILGLWEA
jgi:hypothetical protein